MTEFEKWWKANWDYDTKGKSLGPRGAITDTQVKGGEKKAAKQAWNAALKKLEDSMYENKGISNYTKEFITKLKTNND